MPRVQYSLSFLSLTFFLVMPGLMNEEEIKGLVCYMKETLGNKAHTVKITNRLESHPCVITVQDMASARHFIRTQAGQFNEEMRYSLLQPRLEINPNHPLIKKLVKLRTSDEEVAKLLTEQVNFHYNIRSRSNFQVE